MKHCNIVNDLLPLYLDGVCSDESRQMVEEHISACDSCRELMDTMKIDLPEEAIKLPSDEAILIRTSLTISKRTLKNIVGITSIILYWLMYLLLQSFGEAGDYRYFSYQFHEMWYLGVDLVPLLTLLWLVILAYKTFKRKIWRKNIVLIFTLAILLWGQHAYKDYSAQFHTVTTWQEIINIPDECHIEILRDETNTITLSTSPTVTALLNTDGSEYYIYYKYHPNKPEEGKLMYIKLDEGSYHFIGG